MNTGRVGGTEGDERSKKVRIPHSSAIVKGIAEGTIEWESDPDFGYQVAAQRAGHRRGGPAASCSRGSSTSEQGRTDEYARWVERLKAERVEFLSKYPSLGRDRRRGPLAPRGWPDDVSVKLAVQRTARGLEAAVNAARRRSDGRPALTRLRRARRRAAPAARAHRSAPS